MRARIVPFLVALIGVATGGAEASIPPTYRVLVVSEDREAHARSEALVRYMSAAGAFAWQEPAVLRHEAEACLSGPDFEKCVRALIPRPENWAEPAHVVIRAAAAGPGRLDWTCVGSGVHRPSTAAQRIEVDARTAIFSDGEDGDAQLSAALECIRSAARESVRP